MSEDKETRGVLARWFGRSKPQAALSIENPETSISDFISALTAGAESSAGISVSPKTAIEASAAWRCICLIASTIASMPLNVMKNEGKAPVVNRKHPLWKTLHVAPNPAISIFNYVEMLVVHLLLWGNHYSRIDGANLIPYEPWNVRPERLQSGRIRYETTEPDGTTQMRASSDMLHIPGMSFDGLIGINPISAAGKDSVGLALALQYAMGSLHKNGIRPSGWIEIPGALSHDAATNLRKTLQLLYAGAENHHKTLLLDNGKKFHASQLSPGEAQAMENRRFQTAEICRIFGVPPHLVGETDRSTSWGSGIEQQTLGFLTFTLQQWVRRIEAEIQRKLFDRSDHYAKFSMRSLLRADAASRSDVYSRGIQYGWLTPNECRIEEELPPVDGGDDLWIAQNLRKVNDEQAVQDSEPERGDPDLPSDGEER